MTAKGKNQKKNFFWRINWILILIVLLITGGIVLGVLGMVGSVEVALAGVAGALLLQE